VSALHKQRQGLASLQSVAAYDVSAERLADQYESTKFEIVHADVLDLLPAMGSAVLDVGSGSGRDAAALARLGYRVVAVEPSAGLRAQAKIRHPIPDIIWLDDALPALSTLGRQRFSLIIVSAVWMHLSPDDRADAMHRLAGLLDVGGRLIVSLRIGPEDTQRRILSVDPAAVIADAERAGLRLERRRDVSDVLGRSDIKWVTLALKRP
jgi:protein-L-isoaspartate O-methyltransferase